jgi:hypothetical protein
MGVVDPLAAARARVDALIAAWEATPRLLDATAMLGFPRNVAAGGLAAEIAAWRDRPAFDAIVGPILRGVEAARLPRRVVIIAARTLPASAMRQMLAARALGAEVRLKPASGQADLGEALCADGRFGADIAMLMPDGPGERDDARLDRELEAADTVVVLGSDTTVATLAARTPPGRTFVGFGHRISAAVIGPVLAEDDLAAVAEDVVAWDRSGCLSPQRLWANGIEPLELARSFAPHLAAATTSSPLGAAQAMERRVDLTRARMAGAKPIEAGRFALVVGVAPESIAAAGVLPVEPFDDAAFTNLLPVLSTLGVPPTELARWRARVPASVRVTPVGTMQTPPLTWAQDGHPAIACLLKPA